MLEENIVDDHQVREERIGRHHHVLAALDNSSLSGFHIKAMITSGMGFFTDAYDLFIIGVALAVLTPLWKLNSFEVALLGSTSLIAAANKRADVATARRGARAFKVNQYFKAAKLPAGLPL